MELIELEKELFEKNKWLVAKLSEQKDLIQKSGQSEHDYRVALAVKLLQLRTDGYQATIMTDLAKGDKIIAKLKLERDINRGIADACKEAIRAIQAMISGIQSLISTRKEEMKLQ